MRLIFHAVLSTPIYFYSRTSCEVRLGRRSPRLTLDKFLLTHLLRGATCSEISTLSPHDTLPLSPLARCDRRGQPWRGLLIGISTHAPLARCDPPLSETPISAVTYFYSRTSCEVRRNLQIPIISPPVISTHAPLARCDMSYPP